MADEPIIEPHESEAQKRITQLSEKVKLEAEGRTAAEARAKEAEQKAAFSDGFSDLLSTNPAAKEFKADIQAKVASGMSVEDAGYAVLGKAGKLGSSKPVEPTQAAGGSAPNQIQTGTKTITEMSQAERREALSKDLMFT